MNIATMIMALMFANVTVDHGTKTLAVDAGVVDVKKVIQTRRDGFVKDLKAAFEVASQQRGTKVEVAKVLWATTVVTDTLDAALVLLDAGGEQVGLLFMYRNGEWRAIPEDFK